MSLQQFLELADCRVGLTQWSRQIVPASGFSDLEVLHWYWQPKKNNQETEHTNNTKQHNKKWPKLTAQ